MNLTVKKVGEIKGTFVIESYQRGYRWTEEEIKFLLEDINELPNGQTYCLQPVVVKDVDCVYELIDGQQRMTTLYLIMKYLSAYIDIQYSIEYTTRKSNGKTMGSKELLENIDRINLSSPSFNIDELFIKNAYAYIQEWFKSDKACMMNFALKLQNYITIIWYEVDAIESSVNIFTRLNIGKISLTNAELVKALFLSRGRKEANVYQGNPYGIDDKKQHEIALEWDAMEKELHDAKFWAFITNEDASKYPIRMELFFDIMEKKPNKESNFYTFNRFYEQFRKSVNKFDTWETIVRYFQQLKEWYKDFNLYHQIGYLIAVGENSKDLLDLSMNPEKPLKKSQFKEEVLKKIRNSVIFTQKNEKDESEIIDYADLSYERHEAFIHTLLLLFNVETIRQKGDENNRFPFERYKKQGTWSLEHIHAQNSEGLKTEEEWRYWLDAHKKSLVEIKGTYQKSDSEYIRIESVIQEIKKVMAHIDDKNYKGSIRDEFAAVSPSVIDILFEGNDKTQMHTLSNMALLTVGENAALSNSTFDVKRSKIIEMDKKGEYIPVCTKNVFMKYYSTSDTKLHFWSHDDRKCYIEAINEVLYHHTDIDKQEIQLIYQEIHYGNNK